MLATLARSGDETAFEELVRRHEHQALAVAPRMISQYQDAQDAVQDAFLHAWRSLPALRGQAGFGTWLTPSRSTSRPDPQRRPDRHRAVQGLAAAEVDVTVSTP